ncbi:MAG TPA: DNA mismatch repair protein MutS [Candidatus Limnocylindria bacterium]|nr:DNA mismatch repair protein MutS [Candidatus Limnocylindria bacterium]
MRRFCSVLFDRAEDRARVEQAREPACFRDLNLDRVVASITVGREEYDLESFFYVPLRQVASVSYRQEVLRDLEGEALSGSIASFAEKMRAMRAHLARSEKLRHAYQKEAWFLDAAQIYGEAVARLSDDLAGAELRARGLIAFREQLSRYVRSDEFTALVADTAQVREDLAQVRYGLHIATDRVTVRKYESEADYAAEVEATFEKFKRGAVKDYRVRFRADPEMDHVEAGILERVALLYPDVFRALDEYCDRHRRFLDATIASFDREVQFYVAYLEHVRRIGSAGLRFCYPHVSGESKAIAAKDTFDLALAQKLVSEKQPPVVTNDLDLHDRERVFVVTGPNQGGKTTFARTVGQLHYLASLGCLVPGSEARLFLCDEVFTHFEREEHLADLRGKLQDDLVRIHAILERATSKSVVILNEIFTSTTLRDARFLSEKVLARILDLDLICVWVTFVHELASVSEATVSVVSAVDPAAPTRRTYKIVRMVADGRAYATAIAAKYRLTYGHLKDRLGR